MTFAVRSVLAPPAGTDAVSKSRHARLFEPVTLGPWLLRNRIVLGPMTRRRAGPGDVAGPMQAEYYAQRAQAGLIVSEGTQVSAQGQGYARTPGIHTPAQVAGWRGVTEAVHAAGGRIVAQLWHVGRVSHPCFQPDGAAPVGPSPLACPVEVDTPDGPRPCPAPRALATHEMADLVAQFRTAAGNALAAGFDGVELHAGNGFLFDQFLRDGSNRRGDRYGGSIANRARLLLEATEAVIEVCGPTRVGVRISPLNPWGGMADSDPTALFSHLARELSHLGIAFLDVAELRTRRPIFDWARLRRHFSGCYLAGGGFDGYRADAALWRGRADMIVFGRAFIANPDLPHRLWLGLPPRAADPACHYGGEARGYTDFPPLGAHDCAAVPPFDWRRAALARAKWW